MRYAISLLAILLVAACEQKPTESSKSESHDEGSRIATPQADPAAKQAPETPSWESVPELSVQELEQAMKAGALVVDANGTETRAKFGVIPGATMLASYRTYEPSKVLPADKSSKIVFYCSNTKCTAAPKAAAKAIKAGYTDVSHLKVGIMGWVDAGKSVNRNVSKS